MKYKTGILTILLAFLAIFAYTQIEDENFPILERKRKQIESQKIAFITQKLDLSPEEAQVFWPVYNEYNKQTREENKRFHEKHHILMSNFEIITDEEAEELIDARIIHAQKLLDIEKEYYLRLKNILPPKKIVRLFEAEREFKKILIKKLNDIRSGRKRW